MNKLKKIILNPKQVIRNRLPKRPLPHLHIRIWPDLLSSLPLTDTLLLLIPKVSGISGLKDSIFLPEQIFFTSNELDDFFNNSGTDKSKNGYSPVYSTLLTPIKGHKSTLVEIGIGTNNVNLPSNMGMSGIPGASLRAFSSYLGPETQIYGLDIDRSIFFETESIHCEFVDQLNQNSFQRIQIILEERGGADLIIDDGLHRPLSCINTLIQLLPFIKIGGVFVIEDQDPSLNDYWSYALSKLESNFIWRIVMTRDDISMILIQRTY
jgi:hypothetical protein